jgi:hypothetical protein
MQFRLGMLGLLVQPAAIGLKLTRALTTKKARYDLKRLMGALAQLQAQFDAFERECRSLSREPTGNDRRQLLRDKHSALLADQSRLLIAAEELKAPQSNLGIAAFRYMLTELQASNYRFSRKHAAFMKIFS